MEMRPIIRDAQAAYAFVTAQGRNLEAGIYRRRYPTFDFAQHVPVVTEGSAWAIGTQFRISDFAGKAKFVSGKARDIPFVKTTHELLSHDFLMVAAGWEWSMEEVEQAQLYNISVRNDDAMAGDAAVQRKLYEIAMEGDNEVNWTGLVNDQNVQQVDAAATGGENGGGGTSTFWIHKTVDEILFDIDTALGTVRVESGEVEQADTLRLPPAAFRFLATKRLGTDGSMGTALQYVRTNNIYTAETNLPLDIAPLRALTEAADGDRGRLIAYRKDPEVLRFHLPLPRLVLPVNQVGLMAFEQGVISRTGGTEIRLPGAMVYMDGITAEPS